MKKAASIVICALLCVVLLAGCGKERILYNGNLSKYVELGEYKNITVETSSDNFMNKYYKAVIESDVSSGGFYVKKTEGEVAKGDTANIDYVGKKDGVAFDGGTASGYDLKIGSGSFIDGFEEGLIGVSIGSTVDLNLTFPENYGSAELAGKAVVFTVKVNYVTTEEPKDPRDYYSQLGFSTLEEYTDNVIIRAVNNNLSDIVVGNSTINSYPRKDREKLEEDIIAYYNEIYQSSYGADLETVLKANGATLDGFKEQIADEVTALMKDQLVFYSIFDSEKLSLPEDYDAANSNAIEEYYAIQEAVIDYLYENAAIK